MMYTSHLLLFFFFFFLGGGNKKEKKKKKTDTLWDEQARTNKPGQAKDSVGTNKPRRTSPGEQAQGRKSPLPFEIHNFNLLNPFLKCVTVR